MKNYIFIVGLMLPIFVSALEPIECQFDGATKAYIKNNFDSGYPREVIFQCGYQCQSFNKSLPMLIIGTHKLIISNTEHEAYGTTCSGVKIKPTKWGYDFDGIEPFYAHNSKLNEIKTWANENGRNSQIEDGLRLQLIANLKPIIEAYIIAGNSNTLAAPAFSEAAILLAMAQSQLIGGSFIGFDLLLVPPREHSLVVTGGSLAHAVAMSLGYWRTN